MSSFVAVRPGVKSRRLSNFETSCEWAAIVKFQLSWAELRIAAAVKFHVGELQIELQKLDAAAIYIYISPFIIT